MLHFFSLAVASFGLQKMESVGLWVTLTGNGFKIAEPFLKCFPDISERYAFWFSRGDFVMVCSLARLLFEVVRVHMRQETSYEIIP